MIKTAIHKALQQDQKIIDFVTIKGITRQYFNRQHHSVLSVSAVVLIL